MCHLEKLDSETSDVDRLFRNDRMKLSFLDDAVLFQLVFDKSHSESRPIHRHIQIGKDERKSANVVFVAVREEDRFDFTLPFEQIGDIGNDDVDTEKLLVRKHHARIHNNDGSAAPEGHHVHTEFAEAAKRNNFECLVGDHLRVSGPLTKLIIETQKFSHGQLLRTHIGRNPCFLNTAKDLIAA